MQVQYYQGFTYYALGDYQRAMDSLSRNVDLLVGARSQERFGLAGFPAVFSQNLLAWCLMERGAFAEGKVHTAEAVRMAEALNQPFSLTLAYHGAGVLCLRQGDLRAAVPLFERGLALCQDGSAPLFFAPLAVALGVAYALCGRVADTLLLLEQVAGLSTSLQWPQFVSPFLWMGEASLLVDRLEEAMMAAGRALKHACARQERGYQAQALHLLGAIAAHRGPPALEHAATHYHQALALAADLGMRPLQAHGHYGLGTVYLQMRRPAQARAALAAALALYRTMAMTFWLPQAEAALAQAG